MRRAQRFDFRQARTCVLVGAGHSMPLGYRPFWGEANIRDLCLRAMEPAKLEPTLDHYNTCCSLLVDELGPRLNWDLERIHDHLAHVPEYFYPPKAACNTNFMRQWLIREISSELSNAPAGRAFEKAAESLRRLVRECAAPVAVFTTNYDLVIEHALAGLPYANGWVDNQYSRANFEAGEPVEIALVKLHGSAGWKHATQYTTLQVGGDSDKVTQRPALLEPSRHKRVTQEPYASAYDFLEQSFEHADLLIVMGFSWRDLSVASALRRAVLRRAQNRPLKIAIFDLRPQMVEERIRYFLHESGLGGRYDSLRWRHAVTRFPDVHLASASERGELAHTVALEDRGQWLLLTGEPCMIAAADGTLRVWWEDDRYYFESGRAVLIPRLPDRFDVELTMTMVKYGSGWDPGISLEDEQGNEILFARFIRNGEVWRHESEEPVDGLRIGRGIDVRSRVKAELASPVHVMISSAPGSTVLEVTVSDRTLGPWRFEHFEGRRPRRLQLGGYPWYSDYGIAGTGRATECVIGRCTVTPRGS